MFTFDMGISSRKDPQSCVVKLYEVFCNSASQMREQKIPYKKAKKNLRRFRRWCPENLGGAKKSKNHPPTLDPPPLGGVCQSLTEGMVDITTIQTTVRISHCSYPAAHSCQGRNERIIITMCMLQENHLKTKHFLEDCRRGLVVGENQHLTKTPKC